MSSQSINSSHNIIVIGTVQCGRTDSTLTSQLTNRVAMSFSERRNLPHTRENVQTSTDEKYITYIFIRTFIVLNPFISYL